jgi:ATP-dependent RNA helicase DeaD
MQPDETRRQDAPEPRAPGGHEFDQMGLSAELRQALAEMRYERPTDVQFAVWEPAVAGRDVVVQSQTGSGKTAAFGMPLVDRIVRRGQAAVQAMVLCPTRELALQVCKEVTALGQHKGTRTIAVYGGAPMGRQVEAIARGAHIVTGTPGRVLDHLTRRTLDPASIRVLVLDECDEMLSMGFERELTAILERLPEGRQTWLFSATIPPDIERMARTRLRKPELIVLSGGQIGPQEIRHFVYHVSQDKRGALVRVLEIEDPESAIVFCNTRDQTELVAQHLGRAGFQADWLNGDLPQADRETVMRRTREGKLRFLVATDLAARGIDISHLTHVINFDFPQDAEGYVHRTGRTGRAGRTGTAISLVTPQDIGALYILRLTYKIRPLERQLPTDGEQRTRAELDTVAAILRACAAAGTAPEHRALARRLLSHDDAETAVAGLLREHLAARPDLGADEAALRRARVVAAPVTEPVAPPLAPAAREALRPEPSREPPPAAATHAESEAPVVPAGPKMPRPPRRSARTGSAPSEERERAPDTLRDPDGSQPGEREPRASSPEEAPPAPNGSFVELHLNRGRRDGARIASVRDILERADLPAEHIGRIRVRERYTFVDVAAAAVPAALAAFNAASIDGARLVANVSARSAQPRDPED